MSARLRIGSLRTSLDTALGRRAGRIAVGFALFALLFGLLAAFVFAMPVLYDTDSYCHLGIALDYQESGLLEDLPSVRYSVMSEGFGDKDLLFHLLLSRFVHAGSSDGGRVALALLGAAALTAVSMLAARAVGSWGLLVGPTLMLLAQDLPDRLLRLRPELLGLLLLLLATDAAARRRHRTVGLLFLILTLAYNISQLLVIFVAGWFAVRWWRRNRPEWAGVLYPLLGIGLGLVLHPHFPKNLEVWYLITFEHLGRIGEFSEGGAELLPARAVDIFRNNLGWWVAMIGLAAALTRLPAGSAAREQSASLQPAAHSDGDEAGCYTVAALGFAALYFGVMWRFGLYFYPFVTLAILHEARQHGFRFGGWTPAAGRARLPTAAFMVVVVALALIPARAMARFFLDSRAPGPPREVEWRQFGAAVPEGARVAAPWGEAGAYMFWAPQGRYLNILDPLYMADEFPKEYAAQKALFAGELPDVPLAVGRWLDSDHLAFSRFLAPPRLLARAAADPRLEPVYSGYNLLYRLRPHANESFWLDWSYRIEGTGTRPRDPDRYLRASGEDAALEGFVDANRVGADGRCVQFMHPFKLDAPERLRLEFAPYGPGRLAIDGELRVDLRAATGAVLGKGVQVELDLAAGAHLAEVESCPAPATTWNGFFLRTVTPL
jgi:hypothetical protein